MDRKRLPADIFVHLLCAAALAAAGAAACGKKAVPGGEGGDAGTEGEGEGASEGEGEGAGGPSGPPAGWTREWPDGPALAGNVVDEAGPVAGARVVVHPGEASQETDAQGAFLFANLGRGDYAVEVTADDHVGAARRIPLTTDFPEWRLIELKPRAAAQAVTLPEPGGDPVVVEAAGGLAAVALEAGDLADAAGAAVTGEVSVVLTAFGSNEDADLGRFPADLETAPASAGAAPGALVTFGISDLAVFQGEAPLAVADGATVTWRTPIHEERRGLVVGGQVDHYVLDGSTAYWAHAGAGTYDAHEATASVELEGLGTVMVARPY